MGNLYNVNLESIEYLREVVDEILEIHQTVPCDLTLAERVREIMTIIEEQTEE